MTLYRILNFCAYKGGTFFSSDEIGRIFFSERIGDIIIVEVGVVPPTCGKLGRAAALHAQKQAMTHVG